MPRGDLERLVHEELRRLSPPPAPGTLLPRVMAAAQAWMRRPWYARAWFTWPVGLQVLSVATVVGLLAGVAVIAPGVEQVVRDAIASRASGPAAAAARAIGQLGSLVTAARIVWRALAAPIVPYAFVIVALMCLACAMFGTALNRAAFGRT